MKYTQLCVGLLLMLVFLGFSHADNKNSPSVYVSHAYINSMPPGVNVTAGFFEIKNAGKVAITLNSIISPVVDRIELHRTDNIEGKMAMKKVVALVIEAGEKVKLEHGGIHLMLWGLDAPLVMGSGVPISLIFSNGSVVKIQAELKDIRRETSPHHDH